MLELAFAEDRILATASVADFVRLASSRELRAGISIATRHWDVVLDGLEARCRNARVEPFGSRARRWAMRVATGNVGAWPLQPRWTPE